MTWEAVLIDLPAAGGPFDHYAIRHKPTGQILAWDGTLSPNLGEAMRYSSERQAESGMIVIDPATRAEYDVIGLRYRPAPDGSLV
jgi:hypothetical protein